MEASAGRVPTLTLFCGLPGSGKSTLARRLEAAGVGVRLATDEWQAAVGIPHADGAFHERLQALLYRHALVLLRAGVDVILENGLWMAHERASKFADARSTGARISLHVFDTDLDTLWARIEQRNTAAAADTAPISEAELRAAWDVFEPVRDDELAAVDEYSRHRGGLG